MWMSQRDQLAAYFALAFGITWIGIAVVSAVFGPSLVGLFVPMAAGPTTAALTLTSVGRKTTVRALLAGLVRWRVDARWYAVALLLSPMLLLTVLGLLRIVSTDFTPGLFTATDTVALVGFAVLAGVASALFEEIGWTGFATPRLLARYGYLRAGALLGTLWATWHIAADLSGIGEWGELLPLRVLAWMYAMMVPYRILMTKVYSRTGSLLIGVLMHATFTGGQALLEPIGISHQQQLVWWGAAGAALWVVVGLVIAFDRPSVNATLEEEKRAMPADGIVPAPVL